MDRRSQLRWEISRRLYNSGYSSVDVRELLTALDDMMPLPPRREWDFNEKLIELEESMKVKYVTSHERIGIQKGIQKGIQRGLQKGLKQGLQQGLRKGLQQGMQKGLKQGLGQGRQQAATALTVRLARKKFPGLRSNEKASILKLPLARLEALSEAILEFEAIADLREWLADESPESRN